MYGNFANRTTITLMDESFQVFRAMKTHGGIFEIGYGEFVIGAADTGWLKYVPGGEKRRFFFKTVKVGFW